MKNPISVGDKAWAVGAAGTIVGVRGDHVLFRSDKTRQCEADGWRHWTNCFYGADVILRLLNARTTPSKLRLARRRAQ